MLVSGRRGNTITNLYKDSVCFDEDGMRISISELSKTSVIGRHEPEIVISKFKNVKICCVEYMKA